MIEETRIRAHEVALTRYANRIYQENHRRDATEEAVTRRHETWDHEIRDSYELVFEWESPHSSRAPRVRVHLHERSAVDRLSALMPPVERARLAYERGIHDGLRLETGEVSADQLCAEFNEDPP